MTREEYEKLLKSEYWKGYSYSLIKERNFTCEDCGKRFFNERNKLQVHHLVYRDINPWSYNPDEVVVLCESCHKKRHGIMDETEYSSVMSQTQVPPGDYTKSYSFSQDCKEERSLSSRASSMKTDSNNGGNNNTRLPDPFELARKKAKPRHGFKFKYVVLALLLLFALSLGLKRVFKNGLPIDKILTTESAKTTPDDKSNIVTPTTSSPNKSNKSVAKDVKQKDNTTNQDIIVGELNKEQSIEEGVLTIEQPISEQTQYGNIATESSQQGQSVPTSELSTSEINDRIYRKHVEERAKAEGVSTEGSTSDINDRIYRKHVEERARREGVSTEGSTSDINDRIYRKHVEERARREGVSTEGSTSDINDRIYRKHVEERARREGVSLE